MSRQSHSAARSALGYFYQSQWPLLELLRGSGERPDCAITLELHDDVAWDVQGTPTDLLQVKHHLRATRRLGDKDVDVWRTIRAWMNTQDVADPNGPTLTLVTTQIASEGSAAAALRPMDHDPIRALGLLEAAARDSTAQETRATRARFLDLPAATREIFVRRMYVLDTAPTIGDLDAEVRRELRWALPRGHEDTFMDLLWSWWHGKVVDMLQRRRQAVRGVDVAVAVDDLRDRFTVANLPTLVQVEEFDTEREGDYVDRHFVHQLRWVDTPATLIQKAIIDYYRAYTQTAWWVDDDLVGLDELDAFEKKLRDEWEREFAWMLTELPADADDTAKRRAGLGLLRSRLDQTAIRVCDRYDEAFFSRGKCHELADDGRVGWHPDFAKLLEHLLLAVAP